MSFKSRFESRKTGRNKVGSWADSRMTEKHVICFFYFLPSYCKDDSATLSYQQTYASQNTATDYTHNCRHKRRTNTSCQKFRPIRSLHKNKSITETYRLRAKAYNKYIAQQAAYRSCSGAVRHRQSGHTAYRPVHPQTMAYDWRRYATLVGRLMVSSLHPHNPHYYTDYTHLPTRRDGRLSSHGWMTHCRQLTNEVVICQI